MACAQLLPCHFCCQSPWKSNPIQVAPQVFKQIGSSSFLFQNSKTNQRNRRQSFVKVQAARALTTMHNSEMKVPHVLTVAGSDSGGGAGIQADLKACAARRVYCSTVITAVTAQNTVGVQGVDIVPEDFVAEQLKSVLSDMHVDVVKTGMLPSPGIVKVLCQSLREFPVRALVVDPVMVSTSGDVLAGPSVLAGFREELLPLADIVTPNIKEASILLGGLPLKSVSDMRAAAKLIRDMGPRNVLVKGGDLPDSSDAIDVLFDGEGFYELCSSCVNTRSTHGTGCTLASCIAAELAKGSSILQAVEVAKRFIGTALDYSKDIVIGTGKRNAEIKKIERKSARYVCFSKRREGLFKKAQQYHTVSGSHIAVLVLSPCGRPYVHGSPSFDPIVDKFLQTSTTTTPTTGGSVSGPTVSESASTDVGLRECVEAIKVEECESLEELMEMKRKLEECESLEELMEMKRKLEEIRGMVVQSFVDSFILEDF